MNETVQENGLLYKYLPLATKSVPAIAVAHILVRWAELPRARKHLTVLEVLQLYVLICGLVLIPLTVIAEEVILKKLFGRALDSKSDHPCKKMRNKLTLW